MLASCPQSMRSDAQIIAPSFVYLSALFLSFVMSAPCSFFFLTYVYSLFLSSRHTTQYLSSFAALTAFRLHDKTLQVPLSLSEVLRGLSFALVAVHILHHVSLAETHERLGRHGR